MTHKKQKKVHKVYVLKCWKFFFLEYRGFLCSLGVLKRGLGLRKLPFVIKKIGVNFFFNCNFFSIFGRQKSWIRDWIWIRIWIRNQKKCCIRIRIQDPKPCSKTLNFFILIFCWIRNTGSITGGRRSPPGRCWARSQGGNPVRSGPSGSASPSRRSRTRPCLRNAPFQYSFSYKIVKLVKFLS